MRSIIQVTSGILILRTLLLYGCTARVLHTEPIVSPLNDFLYSFDKVMGKYLNPLCDCSNVNRCSCRTQFGKADVHASVALTDEKTIGDQRSTDLEVRITVFGFEIYKEKKNINDLQEKCSLFEDKKSYVVNKTYCIRFNVEQNTEKVKVCAELAIHEMDKSILNEPILCVSQDRQQ